MSDPSEPQQEAGHELESAVADLDVNEQGAEEIRGGGVYVRKAGGEQQEYVAPPPP